MKRGAIILWVMATALTMKLGTIEYHGHKETWYNLKMNKVVERADGIYGLSNVYKVREDGVKTYNGFVIVAADLSVPYGTVVETSRGIGIVLDYHTIKNGENVFDLATAWGK